MFLMMNTFGGGNGGGHASFNHGCSNSRGVMILFRRDLSYKINMVSKDNNGRILLMDVEINGNGYTLGTLYAPTADGSEEQIAFMDDLEARINELNPINIVIGGDLNVAMDPVLDRRSTSLSHSYGEGMRLRTLAFTEEFNLCDVWRRRNQAKRGFTFYRANQASRIDYWLISTHLIDGCSDASILPMALSDHSMITLSLGEAPLRRGPGIWRFNARLLCDEEYIHKITEAIIFLTREPTFEDPIPNWEWIKFEIRNNGIRKRETQSGSPGGEEAHRTT